MKWLIHICCAPCLCTPLRDTAGLGGCVRGLFFNPNIHPFLEFRRRADALRSILPELPFPVDLCEDYGLEPFLKAVAGTTADERCRLCIRMRMQETARCAKESGCDAFSTTLLASVHQKHDLIRQVGEEEAARVGIAFRYHDWRPEYRQGLQTARTKSLYLQPYCGCIFSEYERYGRRKNPNVEIRISKSEANPKSEVKDPKSENRSAKDMRASR